MAGRVMRQIDTPW